MSDVEILFDDKPGDQAVLLLAAAESLGVDPSEIRTVTGGFLVSTELADEAGFGEKKPEKTTKPRK